MAEKIAAAGIDLKIDVAGLKDSGKAEKQLRCIAEKGNGDYYDADDTEDLERSLSRLTSRGFRPFALSGTPITGTAEPGEAPRAGPGRLAGQTARRDRGGEVLPGPPDPAGIDPSGSGPAC